MHASDPEFSIEYIRIPPVFYSYATNRPFEECLTCKRKLLTDGTQYIIEKAIKKYPGFNNSDVVTEFAICLACNEKLHETLSAHSKKVINDYFTQKVDLSLRRQNLLREKGTHLDAWLNHCLIYNTPQSHIYEFQIYAHCDGQDLIFTQMPFMISGRAIGEIADMLSAETRQVLDDFVDQHFSLPPEYKSMLKDSKMILL